jgi:ER membrane protein complex subunit 10
MAALSRRRLLLALLSVVLSFSLASAFQSDELVLNDDDEFEGLGARLASPSPPAAPVVSSRRRSADASSAGAGESNVVQFTLEHDLGDGKGFVPAGSFSARLKSTAHGSQV